MALGWGLEALLYRLWPQAAAWMIIRPPFFLPYSMMRCCGWQSLLRCELTAGLVFGCVSIELAVVPLAVVFGRYWVNRHLLRVLLDLPFLAVVVRSQQIVA